MPTITIDVPDELSTRLAGAGDRLPELLAAALREPLPVHAYRYVLDFLAERPTPEQLARFAAPPEMSERVRALVARERATGLTPAEQSELDEYERLEHLMIMIKAGALRHLTESRAA